MEYWIRKFVNLDLSPSNSSYYDLINVIKNTQNSLTNIWIEKTELYNRVSDLEKMMEYEKEVKSNLENKIQELQNKLDKPLSFTERIKGKLIR